MTDFSVLADLIVDGGSSALLLWLVYWLTTKHLPKLQQDFERINSESNTQFTDSLSDQRREFVAELQSQRKDFVSSLEGQRQDFMLSLNEQARGFRDELKDERQFWREG